MTNAVAARVRVLAAIVSYLRIYPSSWRIVDWASRAHWRRYILGWIVSLLGIGSLTSAYMIFWPASYTSEWTLILPGAGAGSNVNVSSIGQSSSIISSPFGQSSLSPKAIYKEIATSSAVREVAAHRLEIPLPAFGAPKVKLIQQTALILFSINGPTAEVASEKAAALHIALEEQLQRLRLDEIDKRALAVEANLISYASTLDQSRKMVMDLQQRTGLVSIAQFGELTMTMEQLRNKLAELRADEARLFSQQQAMASGLGISVERAARSIELAADPSFIKLAREYADASSQFADRSSRFGPNHPQYVRERARIEQTSANLAQMARRVNIAESEAFQLLLLVDAPTRSDLLQSLVRGAAELEGKRQQIIELDVELARAKTEVETRSSQAAQLDNLQKKQMVAEAGYSSAVARIDTNRADIYASYPLVQVLSPPTLPTRPSNPRLLFAIIGFLLGSTLATGAWFMAWLYQLFVLKRSKNA